MLSGGDSDTCLILVFGKKKKAEHGYLSCLVFYHVAATSSLETKDVTAEGCLREEEPEGVALSDPAFMLMSIEIMDTAAQEPVFDVVVVWVSVSAGANIWQQEQTADGGRVELSHQHSDRW